MVNAEQAKETSGLWTEPEEAWEVRGHSKQGDVLARERQRKAMGMAWRNRRRAGGF